MEDVVVARLRTVVVRFVCWSLKIIGAGTRKHSLADLGPTAAYLVASPHPPTNHSEPIPTSVSQILAERPHLPTPASRITATLVVQQRKHQHHGLPKSSVRPLTNRRPAESPQPPHEGNWAAWKWWENKWLTLRSRFNQQLLIDTTPLPENIPAVKEIGASSAPLLSASFFIGARCRDYNDDFMQCKTENPGRGEFECLKEGRRVTRCASSVYVSLPMAISKSFYSEMVVP